MVHSVDETWDKILWKGDYTYLVMPQIEEEAKLMMNNLLPYLRHEYGDGVLAYFTSEIKELSKDDKWDPVQKRVICAVDTNAEMEDDGDELGFAEAVKFLEEKEVAQQARKANASSATTAPERPSMDVTPLTNEMIQQEAAEQSGSMQ